jgi:Family of unknown function (DUF6879)
MSSLLGGATGVRLELADYYTDFQRSYSRAREFWKLERGQTYSEPGDESWKAFDNGDWDKAMRLLEDRRADLIEYFRDNASRGLVTRRVRIVSLPPTGYLQWELNLLKIRDELGGSVRILLDDEVAGFEDQGPVPDIYTLDDCLMYEAMYDDHGVLDHARRYTDKILVRRCRNFIADLYARGEPIRDFFQREISHLPSARPSRQSIPHDYLEQAGRPRPIRS